MTEPTKNRTHSRPLRGARATGPERRVASASEARQAVRLDVWTADALAEQMGENVETVRAALEQAVQEGTATMITCGADAWFLSGSAHVMPA